LESKYANQLVVIGVHSAKFENEKQTENIRRIILRYELEHPVVNDADFAIWQSYAVHAWPTQYLIDPEGYVLGRASGEGNYEALDKLIGQTVEEFRKRGLLNEEPLKLALERAKVGDLPLAFPGKVLADAAHNRLFIADSNHNRIVVTSLDGVLMETIGTGAPGQADGAYDRAGFHRPQGMALDGDSLYVADTENHLIRWVDLKAKIVSTVAGTGQQSRAYGESGPARSIALNSPWDLQLLGRTLFIAMAGPHQIWKLDLDKQTVATFAGSGREGRGDGPLPEAAFAQPSAVTSDGQTLYVSDAEANIIRAVDLKASSVRTLVGGDLFDFGDVDGEGDQVRLQHPLGLVAFERKLLIADTYNHKIKLLDPRTRTVKTFLGTGKPGQADGGSPSFYEPGGLSVGGGKLYIADTDNHAIRVVDLKSKKTRTLAISGLMPPAAIENVADSASSAGPNAEGIRLQPRQLRARLEKGSLVVDVTLPAGYHLNSYAPQHYKVSVESGAASLAVAEAAEVGRKSKDLKFPLRVPLHTLEAGNAELKVSVTMYYCRDDDTGTCQIKTLNWNVPVEVMAGGTGSDEIRVEKMVQ
jgi:DNA-binding beta-propeller fold protein YncE